MKTNIKPSARLDLRTIFAFEVDSLGEATVKKVVDGDVQTRIDLQGFKKGVVQ